MTCGGLSPEPASGASAGEKTAPFSGATLDVYRLDRLTEALAVDLSPR
ncbi:MAG: hypothetical protein JO339_38275 [Alphaproteobacteria bacterium]|nr:hypothetical protein [Alphaproteobacteria bacterium]